MENVDSGWEKKEWVCEGTYWLDPTSPSYEEGCGWKGLGSECRHGDYCDSFVEMVCPSCEFRIVDVEFPLVGSGTVTYTWGKYGSK